MNALDRLAKLRADMEELQVKWHTEAAACIPPEIRAEIDKVDDAYSTLEQGMKAEMERLEEQIREEVLNKGETIKGEVMMGMYTEGRVAWDDQKLLGYAATHQEILQFRKQGSPSVSIRKRG